MAFAKGENNQSLSLNSEARDVYVGITPVRVTAVNPTNAELSEILGRKIERDEPKYSGTAEYKDENGNVERTVDYVDIVFHVETLEEMADGRKLNSSIRFRLYKEFFQSKGDNGKPIRYQVIDKYGNTAWATAEQVEAKREVVYDSGFKARIFPGFRRTVRGEEDLVKFIRTFLQIPETHQYDSNTKQSLPIANLQEAECCIDDIKSLLAGKMKELKGIVKVGELRAIKLMFTARQDKNNPSVFYQSVYNRLFFTSYAKSTYINKQVAKHIDELAAFGGSIKDQFSTDAIAPFAANTISTFATTPKNVGAATASSAELSGDDDPFGSASTADPLAGGAQATGDDDPFANEPAPF